MQRDTMENIEFFSVSLSLRLNREGELRLHLPEVLEQGAAAADGGLCYDHEAVGRVRSEGDGFQEARRNAVGEVSPLGRTMLRPTPLNGGANKPRPNRRNRNQAAQRRWFPSYGR
ncbi:MAG: hypothetical protein MdMp014T_2242 [Treponematales bacterium]